MGIVTKHYSDKNEPKSMGITGATVGQIAKITAVDASGVPTEWEAIDGHSDWNQNNETASDYIKNRPFYTGVPVETVLVEESTVSFADNDGIYAAQFPSKFIPTVGETYKVYWDGIVYECICVDVKGMPCLGNLSILGVGSDTGEPFAMAVYTGKGILIGTEDASVSHTISISGLVTKISKIDIKYLPFPFKPIGRSYLTFSSRNSFSLETHKKGWNGTLEYFASNETWAIWDGTGNLSATYDGTEYVMYLRGSGNTIITGDNSSRWHLDGSDIACIGNIENLLDYATVQSGEHPVMGEGCYRYMFNGCTSITRAPELPATTLAHNCYECMFYGCTSLTHAPELPATTLAHGCYHYMFSGCTSLKLSETKTEEYTQEYRIPLFGDGTDANVALGEMFTSTGGTFTGTPEINTTYYLSSDNMIVRGSELANLNGYVKSMINNAECIISSSTSGSTKKFKITVDDTGALSAVEVTTS